MRKRFFLFVLLALTGTLILGGADCESPWTDNAEPSTARDVAPPPLYVAGTVGEHAVLVPGGLMSLQGYGVVIALGLNGSAEVPEHLKKYFSEYLTKQDLGLWSKGMESLPPDRLLRDKDTAVVLLGAVVPPGALAGTTLDLEVADFAQAPTRSLDGGMLMPSELRLAWRGLARPGGPSFIWGRAWGPIFVNPFLDFSDSGDLAKARSGRIIGGGKLVRSRPVKLQLRQPDYQRCRQIESRINEKFSIPGKEKIANALDAYTINLKIPRKWRRDYGRFLRLVLHLPLVVTGADWERNVRELVGHLESPHAEHDELALVLEAAGRHVLPGLKPTYLSKHDSAAFYAARTGLRLGDASAAEVIVRFAQKPASPLQLHAIEELGNHPKLIRAVPILRKGLDEENEMVRLAAYEALLKHQDASRIKRTDVSGEFELDVVKSDRGNVIYATQTGAPRIVLFGSDMVVAKPVFFNASDDLVTITATAADKKLQVFRKIPRSAKTSESFHIDFSVGKLVETLGTRPDPDVAGKVNGLGLTYGQVVRVLYQMCKDQDIEAKFILQPLPQVATMYRDAALEGRPDMPE